MKVGKELSCKKLSQTYLRFSTSCQSATGEEKNGLPDVCYPLPARRKRNKFLGALWLSLLRLVGKTSHGPAVACCASPDAGRKNLGQPSGGMLRVYCVVLCCKSNRLNDAEIDD